jgi:hypothetical protein
MKRQTWALAIAAVAALGALLSGAGAVVATPTPQEAPTVGTYDGGGAEPESPDLGTSCTLIGIGNSC